MKNFTIHLKTDQPLMSRFLDRMKEQTERLVKTSQKKEAGPFDESKPELGGRWTKEELTEKK